MGRRGRQSLLDETLYFVTATVVHFLPVFSDEDACKILIENIKHYQSEHGFIIYAYVIMPTHFHWILEVDPEKASLSAVMRDLKKYCAWDIFDLLETQGKRDLLKRFSRNYKSPDGQRRKFWKSRFDDLYIRSERMLIQKIDYIHENPVKAGLVETPEDYKYSSARNYILDDHSLLRVHTDWEY